MFTSSLFSLFLCIKKKTMKNISHRCLLQWKLIIYNIWAFTKVVCYKWTETSQNRHTPSGALFIEFSKLIKFTGNSKLISQCEGAYIRRLMNVITNMQHETHLTWMGPRNWAWVVPAVWICCWGWDTTYGCFCTPVFPPTVFLELSTWIPPHPHDYSQHTNKTRTHMHPFIYVHYLLHICWFGSSCASRMCR